MESMLKLSKRGVVVDVLASKPRLTNKHLPYMRALPMWSGKFVTCCPCDLRGFVTWSMTLFSRDESVLSCDREVLSRAAHVICRFLVTWSSTFHHLINRFVSRDESLRSCDLEVFLMSSATFIMWSKGLFRVIKSLSYHVITLNVIMWLSNVFTTWSVGLTISLAQ